MMGLHRHELPKRIAGVKKIYTGHIGAQKGTRPDRSMTPVVHITSSPLPSSGTVFQVWQASQPTKEGGREAGRGGERARERKRDRQTYRQAGRQVRRAAQNERDTGRERDRETTRARSCLVLIADFRRPKPWNRRTLHPKLVTSTWKT